MDSLYERILTRGLDRLVGLVDTVRDRHEKPKLKPWPLGPSKTAVDEEPVCVAESPANGLR